MDTNPYRHFKMHPDRLAREWRRLAYLIAYVIGVWFVLWLLTGVH